MATNIVASPLIKMTGQATFAGATVDGFEVLRVTGGGGGGAAWRATVSSACNSCLRALTGQAPWALLLGRLASLIGALALLGCVIAAARVRRQGTDGATLGQTVPRRRPDDSSRSVPGGPPPLVAVDVDGDRPDQTSSVIDTRT